MRRRHVGCDRRGMAKHGGGVDAAEIRRVARGKFGYSSLRPGQEHVIRLILDKRDTLSVMPTGSGKSAIYQIAGLKIGGPTEYARLGNVIEVLGHPTVLALTATAAATSRPSRRRSTSTRSRRRRSASRNCTGNIVRPAWS